MRVTSAAGQLDDLFSSLARALHPSLKNPKASPVRIGDFVSLILNNRHELPITVSNLVHLRSIHKPETRTFATDSSDSGPTHHHRQAGPAHPSSEPHPHDHGHTPVEAAIASSSRQWSLTTRPPSHAAGPTIRCLVLSAAGARWFPGRRLQSALTAPA